MRRLTILLAGAIALPAGIAIASLLLAHANASAGWLRYRLPPLAFWVFVWSGVVSPVAGAGALVFLWRRRSRSGPGARLAVALAITAVLAPVLWLSLAGAVFFAAGGSR